MPNVGTILRGSSGEVEPRRGQQRTVERSREAQQDELGRRRTTTCLSQNSGVRASDAVRVSADEIVSVSQVLEGEVEKAVYISRSCLRCTEETHT